MGILAEALEFWKKPEDGAPNVTPEGGASIVDDIKDAIIGKVDRPAGKLVYVDKLGNVRARDPKTKKVETPTADPPKVDESPKPEPPKPA